MQTSRSVKPNIDIIDFGDVLCLLIELPAVPDANIMLEIVHDILHLEAQMELKIKEDEKINCMDFAEDMYAFNFHLPENVDKESLIAEMHNGLLCIRLDYLEKSSIKHIPIKFS